MTNRRKYPEEFKKDAVRLMLARGTRTIAEVAAELKLSQSMLHRWHQRYGAEVTGGACSLRKSARTWSRCAVSCVSCSRKTRC